MDYLTIGDVKIGRGLPVAIQTMWKHPLKFDFIDNILSEIFCFKNMGCSIIRFAVPDFDSIDVLKKICDKSVMPIVADIHFDYKLALKCVDAGVDKIRINPGNIGVEWKIVEVLKKCNDFNVPIRIGINGGSLPLKYNKINPVDATLLAAEEEINILEKFGFKNVLFSLKNSDVNNTVEVNKIFRKKYSYLLHIGVTEAGPLIPAVVKSTIALKELFDNGIGETIRVSISDDCKTEIITAIEILKNCGKLENSAKLVSCPKCGRALFDIDNSIAQQIQNLLYNCNKKIKVAVMGCQVNGPNEAKDADIGITGIGNKIFIYKKGELYKKVDKDSAIICLKEEIENYEES